MKLGFTGTRAGMTLKQGYKIYHILKEYNDLLGIEDIRHGGCIGADAQFHEICRMLDITEKITIHPGYSKKYPGSLLYRAELEGDFKEVEPLPFLDRNRVIVNKTTRIIAAPKSLTNRTGGTWYTINYATNKFGKKSVALISPEGEYVENF